MHPPDRQAGPATRRQIGSSRVWALALIVSGIICSQTASAAMLGEPTASAPPQQIRLESEIDYSTRDVELDGLCCIDAESLRLLNELSISSRVGVDF